MNACIKQIAYALPEKIVSNSALHEENPTWNMPRVEKSTGVRCRHVAADGETALDLATLACQQLFADSPGLREKVDAIIFCTETPDYIIPPNSCVLHGRLGLSERVLAFDVDLGCSGYSYCLTIAQGFIRSGIAQNVLVVTADTYSKLIHPQDQSVRVLFGDGAAASWIGACDDDRGIIDFLCGTAGQHYEKFIVREGGCRNPSPSAGSPVTMRAATETKPSDRIAMDGMGILAFTNARIPEHMQSLLQRNRLTVQDVDLFVFHQASRMVLDSLALMLDIKPAQLYSNLSELGNLVSASIPVALKDAMQAGRLSQGATVVLCGFGVGLSWGSVLMRWNEG
jgi:3-oxoacyl-[acyl-carrier-protein] synthase III